MEQNTSDTPKQNNYEKIIDELFWHRKELEDMRMTLFDLTTLVGRLENAIIIWVGVAEE